MNKPKVLFIDDEADCFRCFINELGNMGLNIIRTFSNGQEAAEYISTGDYDAAIIDRRLGGDSALGYIDGEELMEMLKKYNPKAKVISFCGYNDKPLYADRVLPKPPLPKDLQEIVNYINS